MILTHKLNSSCHLTENLVWLLCFFFLLLISKPAGMLPPFAVQSEETRAMARHCSTGVEPRISTERIILLDTQVLLPITSSIFFPFFYVLYSFIHVLHFSFEVFFFFFIAFSVSLFFP